MVNNPNRTTIIIGAGPSGIACATQLKRYNIDPLIFEKESIGGLIKNANLIENYPGFPSGIGGNEFIQLLDKQLANNDLKIIFEEIMSIEQTVDGFNVKSNKKEYRSDYIVLASGTKPIIPEIFDKYIGNKIFTEIYQLGEISDKTVAIIGAGDCAFDYAMNLCPENKVIILNRSARIKALPILQNRVFEQQNIQYLSDTIVTKVKFVDDKLELLINNAANNITVDYLLIAVGRLPNLDFVGRQALNNSNLFQIGDVKNGLFRQSSIAIGDGINTAMKINSILSKE